MGAQLRIEINIILALDAFNDCGGTHTRGDAERCKAEGFVTTLEFVQQSADDNRAGRT